MRAASLLAKGLSQWEVARQVGAHRQSVSKWAAELEAKGRAGLKKAGRAGRKPRLGVSTGAKCRWNAEVKSQLKAEARCPS